MNLVVLSSGQRLASKTLARCEGLLSLLGGRCRVDIGVRELESEERGAHLGLGASERARDLAAQLMFEVLMMFLGAEVSSKSVQMRAVNTAFLQCDHQSMPVFAHGTMIPGAVGMRRWRALHSARDSAPRARHDARLARSEEDKIYGANAVRAAFAQRAEAIVRVYVDDARVDDYRDLLRDAAQRRVAYKVVSGDEVAAFAASRHHEGICILAKPPRSGLRFWADEVTKAPCLVALDDVQNPHNLGAIARSAAHFGARAIVRAQSDGRWTGAAFRTAEGGAEFVARVAVRDLADGLRVLKDAGYGVLGLDAAARQRLYDVPLSGPVVIVVGNEGAGLSDDVRAQLSREVRLPGTGQVESLNVSNAVAVALAEVWRQRQRRT